MDSPLLLLAAVCFIAMLSPGPDFVLVTRNALLYPRSQALATTAGIVAGCLVHATYCILGLAFLITKRVIVFGAIKYLGACYLIYIGLKGLFAKPNSKNHETVQEREAAIPTLRGAFLQGFFCNVLNPKLAVFLLSLFTQFIDVDATMGQKAQVAGIFVLESALYWPIVVVILQMPLLKAGFSKLQAYIERLCGAVLVYLGVRVALE